MTKRNVQYQRVSKERGRNSLAAETSAHCYTLVALLMRYSCQIRAAVLTGAGKALQCLPVSCASFGIPAIAVFWFIGFVSAQDFGCVIFAYSENSSFKFLLPNSTALVLRVSLTGLMQYGGKRFGVSSSRESARDRYSSETAEVQKDVGSRLSPLEPISNSCARNHSQTSL